MTTSGPGPDPAVDLSTPSIARVYDVSLGGKDNYAVDREFYARILKVAPHQGEVSRLNRRWQGRVVQFLTDRGISQFLDLGSGLPTMDNTHEVAHRRNPDSVVVYVDNDPVCAAHGRALLCRDRVFFSAADLARPEQVLSDAVVTDHLDFTRPVALLQCGTLHHVPNRLDPVAIMTRYVDALPAGSFVVISHFWNPADENPGLSTTARQLEHTFTAEGLGSGFYRSREQIRTLFAGLRLVEPGLACLDQWRPDERATRPLWPEERLILGGVAVKS